MATRTDNEYGDRSDLGQSLRALRDAARLRQVDAAQAVGITQAKLSRAEQGHSLLDPDTVRHLARLYGASAADVDELVRLATIVRAGYIDARVVIQAGGTRNLQRRFAALEAGARHVRGYQPTMVIGALQTPAYAASVFGVDEDDPLVTERMARQHRMLAETGRRWTFVQTEGSLRWQARSSAVMVAQLEHMLELSQAPNVELGIVDWRTPVEVYPQTAFHLYDETAVVVGTRDGTAIINDQLRIIGYRNLFNEVAVLASFGDDGSAVLRRLADEYRTLA